MAAPINQSTVINNIEFAQKALEIHDIIPLLQFSRLQNLLAHSDGQLSFDLRGGKDSNKTAYLQLKVQGNIALVCQRCLQPFEYEIKVDTYYVLVRDESEMPAPEEEGDDEDYLPIQAEMSVLDLIEDEVLLALPIAPKHEERTCINENNIETYKKPNPFAKLALLKSKK
jgi:uncharacterized protein